MSDNIYQGMVELMEKMGADMIREAHRPLFFARDDHASRLVYEQVLAMSDAEVLEMARWGRERAMAEDYLRAAELLLNLGVAEADLVAAIEAIDDSGLFFGEN